MSFETPILFVIFNRPDVTAKVFSVIRDIQPSYLYIACDGPRSGNKLDSENCFLTRQIVQQVDWPCQIKTSFSDINLGCKKAVSSAISWFFDHVEEGIILEDDCLPAPSFFPFCQTLLRQYRDNPQIMGITGSNLVDRDVASGVDIYFSRFMNIWGWATWKRAWTLFDYEMSGLSEYKEKQIPQIQFFLKNKKDLLFWDYKLKEAKNAGTSWAFPWGFTLLKHNGLCITPRVNLVSNIGYGTNGVHADNAESIFSNLPVGHMKTLSIPQEVHIDENRDHLYTQLMASEQLPGFIGRLKLRSKIISRKIVGSHFYDTLKRVLKTKK